MGKKMLLSVLLLLLLQGCTNPFAAYYYDSTGGADLSKLTHVILSSEEPKIFRGGDPEADNLRLHEEGYIMIGYSAFNAGNVNESGAKSHAKSIKASIVMMYAEYTGSVSGALPFTMPDRQQSTTTYSGSVYGSRGSANYYGSANTTTYGTRTTYIPYTVHRSDYVATYWVKVATPRFGVHIRDLTPEVKQSIGSNKGVLIYAVMKGSPAYDADILRGDVLKKVGDAEVIDKDSFFAAMNKYEGQKVDVVLIRNQEQIIKTVSMRSPK